MDSGGLVWIEASICRPSAGETMHESDPSLDERLSESVSAAMPPPFGRSSATWTTNR